MAFLVKSRGVTPVSWPHSTIGPCQSWPPNNPLTLNWLYHSLSSLHLYLVCGERTGAVVLWLPSHHPSGCCTLVVVEERSPDMIVKRFGCTVVHMKAPYKCPILFYSSLVGLSSLLSIFPFFRSTHCCVRRITVLLELAIFQSLLCNNVTSQFKYLGMQS